MNLGRKKVLVTGGAGFIGSHTVDALVERGAQVAIIDNLTTGQETNLNPEATFYRLNVADPAVQDVFEQHQPQLIYHFAFNVLVPKGVENPLMDMDSIAGSVNMLQNARKYGVEKVVFASSGFLYGNTQNVPTPETEQIRPISPYVVAKRAVENYLEFYHAAFNMSYVVLRYAAVYGPRQVTGAMADYVRKLSSGQQAEIWGDGSKTRDYLYIDDVVRANLLAPELPCSYPDPVFNIGTGIQTTLNDLYGRIAKLLGGEAAPIYLPDRPGEQMRYGLAYAKIRKALGWEPETTLDAGLKRTVEHYVTNRRERDNQERDVPATETVGGRNVDLTRSKR
ncbi:MAG: NAD-dependent epimerase/dehydratase family protein [Chloroflexi bacterium]|nr:NAD-dependent epimerase/dehydratase family protein [Chloroflexota bacterium]